VPALPNGAWVLAASDLGIDVTTPYVVTDRFGVPIEFVAHVRNFGSRQGTLVMHMPAVIPASRLRSGVYFHFSVLNPEHYFDYDRELFIDMLASWGWTGPGQPPNWFPYRA
jgi:hypothetical protein